jgi:ABC-2 type transport system ATP-binding protein
MRADLGAALLHEPPIVYLDEPTIGLDIEVKDRVREFLRDLVANGTTVLLTTHDLGDIEDVCRRIVIVDGGRIIHDGPLAAVRDELARERSMHVQPAVPVDLAAIRAALPGTEVSGEPGEFSIRFDRFAYSAGQVAAAVMGLAEIRDFRIDEPGIEDVVRRVYEGRLSPAPTGSPA